MNELEISPEKAEEKIEGYISQIEGLLEIGYEEGKDEKRQVKKNLEVFLEAAFSDGDEKVNDLHPMVIGGGKSQEETYRDDLNRWLRNLRSWKEIVELEEESQEQKSKVNNLESDVEEAELEAKRRENVAKQKFEGAVIELLDLQRDRIKENEEINKEIKELKKGIEEIKEVLERVVEEQREGDNNE